MNTNDIRITLPASKSMSNRWLMINHLTGGHFRISIGCCAALCKCPDWG